MYKFAATCDYGDSIRRDVADLWVSSAAWPPLRASCNLVHYVRSLIHRFSFVASKASTSQLRACVEGRKGGEGTTSKVTREGF